MKSATARQTPNRSSFASTGGGFVAAASQSSYILKPAQAAETRTGSDRKASSSSR